MTTCPGYGVSCLTTLYRIKSDIQTQLNNNISLSSALRYKKAQRSAENFIGRKNHDKLKLFVLI